MPESTKMKNMKDGAEITVYCSGESLGFYECEDCECRFQVMRTSKGEVSDQVAYCPSCGSQDLAIWIPREKN